jgi:integrase
LFRRTLSGPGPPEARGREDRVLAGWRSARWAVVEALMLHKERSFSIPEGWLFANPVTKKPYHQEAIQKKHIRKAGVASGIGGNIGWHTFRHSYRSWLDETGAPLTVQKELMR